MVHSACMERVYWTYCAAARGRLAMYDYRRAIERTLERRHMDGSFHAPQRLDSLPQMKGACNACQQQSESRILTLLQCPRKH